MLEGNRDRKDRVTVQDSLASWHRGISVLEMIDFTRDRRPWPRMTSQRNMAWNIRKRILGGHLRGLKPRQFPSSKITTPNVPSLCLNWHWRQTTSQASTDCLTCPSLLATHLSQRYKGAYPHNLNKRQHCNIICSQFLHAPPYSTLSLLLTYTFPSSSSKWR